VVTLNFASALCDLEVVGMVLVEVEDRGGGKEGVDLCYVMKGRKALPVGPAPDLFSV
jgi:hypothetical protein